jgi:hypothetical protein
MTVHPPGRTAVYRLFNRGGDLLYVGISSDPPTRCINHSYDKPWWPEVASRTEEWRETRALALKAETAAIRTERPKYNKMGAPDYPPKAPNDGRSVSVAGFRARFTDYVNRTRYGNQITFLYSRDRRVAALVPVDVAERILAEREADPGSA